MIKNKFIKKIIPSFRSSLLLSIFNFYFFVNPIEPDREIKILKSFSDQKDESSGFYNLYNFIQDFFKKYDITYPLNIEFSAKISNQGFNNQRYVISIPKTYLNNSYKTKKLDEITNFIPSEYVKSKIKELISAHNVGSLIYAVDFFKGQNKYKVYFDFPVISQKGITSFEWQEGKPGFVIRDYKPIDSKTFENYLDQVLYNNQRGKFENLRSFLDFNKLLLKEEGDKESLCIKFKQNTLVKDVKKQLRDLAKGYRDSKKFYLFLDRISDLQISWLHLQRGEIGIYTRLNDWVYYV